MQFSSTRHHMWGCTMLGCYRKKTVFQPKYLMYMKFKLSWVLMRILNIARWECGSNISFHLISQPNMWHGIQRTIPLTSSAMSSCVQELQTCTRVIFSSYMPQKLVCFHIIDMCTSVNQRVVLTLSKGGLTTFFIGLLVMIVILHHQNLPA